MPSCLPVCLSTEGDRSICGYSTSHPQITHRAFPERFLRKGSSGAQQTPHFSRPCRGLRAAESQSHLAKAHAEAFSRALPLALCDIHVWLLVTGKC